MPLDVQAVAESQRAKLVFGQLASEEATRLIAKFRHALIDHRLIELVVAIHGAGLWEGAANAPNTPLLGDSRVPVMSH
jgi:hypothetical protein